MARNSTARARIEDALRADFDWALDFTGLNESQFIEAAIKALVEEVRRTGEIRLPLALVAKSSLAPPGKAAAPDVQRSGGPKDAGAARGGGRNTAFPSASQNLNEDSPREIEPAIPAREKSLPRVTRARAVLRKMQEREKESKP